MDSENLHRRLKKIIGQVQAIDRMIDEDVPCEDVLCADQRGEIRAARLRQGRAGGTHQALRPRRHRARRRGQDHRKLHQGGGTVSPDHGPNPSIFSKSSETDMYPQYWTVSIGGISLSKKPYCSEVIGLQVGKGGGKSRKSIHLWMASFSRFIAANLSLTEVDTAVSPR